KKTLTIAEAAQDSDVLNMGSLGILEAFVLSILGPSALTGTVTIEVCDTATGTFITLQSSGNDVTLAAAKAAVLSPMGFPYMRIHSSGAEAADRAFVILAHSTR
ncbi:MAG TPA: hypothetical protein VIG57_11460, partial [Candidatus Entotheonella sp.]